MAVAYKVAGNSSRSGGVAQGPDIHRTNPWEPYRILFYPRLINKRWYLPGDTVYRRWVLSPGGGYWQWGDEFDYLRWQ